MRLANTVLGLALLGLGGCSWLTGDEGFFPDNSDAYRQAGSEAPLQVPADLDDSALQQIYVIPQTTETVTPAGDFEAPRPVPLVAGAADQLVRIQRLGREEWILVELNPGQLWPQVRGFLNATQRPVARVEARAGLIETGWLPTEGNGMQERYRFRMEQGVQRNTAELHVLQMFQAGDVTSWPEISADPERESSMLRAMAQFIANNTESAPVSMMAQQSLTDEGKISMQEAADGSPYIRLSLAYNRGWASVEKALRASNFEILDKDRSQGYYRVQYVQPEDPEGGGMFGWLFGEDESPTSEYSDQQYQFMLQQADEQTLRITAASAEGAALDRELAQSLLALVKGNIN